MANVPKKPNPGDPLVRQVSRRWVLAGVAGMTFAVAVAFSGIFKHSHPALAATLTIACGWLMMLLMCPWRAMRKLSRDERPTIRRLNSQIKLIADGDRETPLKDLILTRDDDFGELSQLVHELATQSHSQRQRSRMLHYRMDQDVQQQTRKATAHLEKQAATDPLTGLGNRRALQHHLNECLNSHGRSGRWLTVMALDFDRFKEVNDTLGHEVGDQCLVFLAELLKNGLRREDVAIRLGGDEFVVLMPDQSLESGQMAANRLASLFAQMPWPHIAAPRPTVSFGLASDVAAVTTRSADLLRRADEALYEAKRRRVAASAAMQRRGAA